MSVLKGVVEVTPADPISSYFNELSRVLTAVRVSDAEGRPLDREAHNAGKKVVLIGNGGSAAVASHHAIEFLKNGGIRATALNDSAALTCLSNDFGYANVFSEQLKVHGLPGDVLIAISSSGQSVNILKAVETARASSMKVVTLSGFQPDNLLRGRGDVNFYVNSNQYGFVEVAHHALIQAILDLYVFPRRPAK
jgi:D-sedoheptulose 7-phosphate isomerase